jgi:hypothetical protein
VRERTPSLRYIKRAAIAELLILGHGFLEQRASSEQLGHHHRGGQRHQTHISPAQQRATLAASSLASNH